MTPYQITIPADFFPLYVCCKKLFYETLSISPCKRNQHDVNKIFIALPDRILP